MTITVNDMVAREVHYCVSSLVSTLCNATAHISSHGDCGGDLVALAEQAFELSCPIVDYEEAAREAGWEVFNNAWRGPNADNWGGYGTAEEVCTTEDIDPYAREVFEHWIVSDWLADRLAEKGEKVDKDFAGMTVWARTTTGQAISIDSVIEEIHAELIAS